ncbi:MAG TPA: PIN domain-containing protein [Candidatus Sumerlaeota bacterium]|nr:PIN domain-containing protein [Candidatus Sumerlaeota bacterium]HPK02772.1 PIN domain-containing protein [Candidatus Sumerlaeota bacterium]
MKTVFADTFFYLALLSEDDASHRGAVAWAATKNRYVTTEFVLLEVVDGMSAPGARGIVSQFLRTLFRNPDTRIVPASSDLLLQGLRLFEQRPDKGWSLTDCTSFVVMEHEHLREVLTGDHHFAQAGFLPLLASASS